MPRTLATLITKTKLSIDNLRVRAIFHGPLTNPSMLNVDSKTDVKITFIILLSNDLNNITLDGLNFVKRVTLAVTTVTNSLSVVTLVIFISRGMENGIALLVVNIVVNCVTGTIVNILGFFDIRRSVHTCIV